MSMVGRVLRGLFEEVEEVVGERTEDEVEEVAEEAAEDVRDEVGDVGGAEAVEEGLEGFDGEAEEKGEEEDAKEAEEYGADGGRAAAALMVGQGEEEAEGDGHDDIEGDLAHEVAATVGDVDEGRHVHRDVGMVEDEGESGDDWHEGKIEDKG